MMTTDTRAVRIHGHEIDPGNGPHAAAMIGLHRLPFQICYCVQDSPENPCACIHGRRWWFEKATIIASGHSDRKDEAGKPLHFFDVAAGSSVLVEMELEDVIAEAKREAKAGAR